MKSFIAIGALFAALASAQGIADLPPCSLQCLLSGVGAAGCEVTDFACACGKADQLAGSVTPCVQTACPNPADQATVITVLEGICEDAGFPITLTPGGGSPSTSAAPPASTSESESEPPASSSEPEPTGGYGAPTYPTGSTCEASTTYTTVTVSPPKPTTHYNVTSAPTPPAYTGAATANGVTFGAALFGLLAYFL